MCINFSTLNATMCNFINFYCQTVANLKFYCQICNPFNIKAGII